jgi:tetratricopeptide (TPR) repeat protein
VGAPGRAALDLAFAYTCAGLWDEAARVLEAAAELPTPELPLIHYLLAWCAGQMGDDAAALVMLQKAAALPVAERGGPAFTNRLEIVPALELAARLNPDDSHAPYVLGNLYYDCGRFEQAIAAWEAAVRIEPGFAAAWRGLGIGLFNIRQDPDAALEAYQNACRCDPYDARLLFELDQLQKRRRQPPALRLARLEADQELVDRRDDLRIEQAALLNALGRSDEAVDRIVVHNFQPWEGGEGLVSGQYVIGHLRGGLRRLASADPAAALLRFSAALIFPVSLGEGRHEVLLEESPAYYWIGRTQEILGRAARAPGWYERAAGQIRPGALASFHRGLALRRLGRAEEAQILFNEMLQRGQADQAVPPGISYFTTSLPNLIVFEDDPTEAGRLDGRLRAALARLGLGQVDEARLGLLSVLERDPSHPEASFVLAFLDTPLPAGDSFWA